MPTKPGTVYLRPEARERHLDPILALTNACYEVAASAVSGSAALTIVDNISTTIARGESIALVGPKGSGKTALLYLMGGLDNPTSGHIAFDGRRVDAMTERERTEHLNQRVGFVHAVVNLIVSATAIDNVMLPMLLAGADRASARQRAEQLLDRVGLGSSMFTVADVLPPDAARRVALARALANEPLLVLIDESAQSLDSQVAASFLELAMTNRGDNQTTIFATTHTEIAELAARRLHLLDGRLVADLVDPGE